MDGAPMPVMRGKKQKLGRWDTKEKVFTATENLREMRRIAVKMLAPFLWAFVRSWVFRPVCRRRS